MPKLLLALKQLCKRLMDDDILRLKHFSISAVIFFVGYAMLYWTNTNMPPSIKQELTALVFMASSALAFFWAISLQILYIISKVNNK